MITDPLNYCLINEPSKDMLRYDTGFALPKAPLIYSNKTIKQRNVKVKSKCIIFVLIAFSISIIYIYTENCKRLNSQGGIRKDLPCVS